MLMFIILTTVAYFLHKLYLLALHNNMKKLNINDIKMQIFLRINPH